MRTPPLAFKDTLSPWEVQTALRLADYKCEFCHTAGVELLILPGETSDPADMLVCCWNCALDYLREETGEE